MSDLGVFSMCSQTSKNKNEILDCCQRFFMPQLKKCMSICDTRDNQVDYDECRTNCKEMGLTSDRFCSLVYSEQELKELDNERCHPLVNDKPRFMGCCKENCIPNSTNDCDAYCEYHYTRILDKQNKNTDLKQTDKTSDILLKTINAVPRKIYKKKNKINLLFPILLSVVCLILGISILII